MSRIGFVKFTQEYVGGIIAGIGGGLVLTHSLVRLRVIGHDFNPLVVIAAFSLIAIGGLLAKSGQRKERASTAQQSPADGG